MSTNIISEFEKAREFISTKLDEYSEVYVPVGLNPINKLTMIKELQKIATTELVKEFPTFPINLHPKFVIKIIDEEMVVDVSIQTYLNKVHYNLYLGSCELEEKVYDLYYDKLSTTIYAPTVVAKYDHGDRCYFSGSRSAAMEYETQMLTPLSIAYKMAVDDGYIK
jgi:hypothetical protein